MFSLQKVVEMADYNMHVRPRVVWSKLWQHISQLFEVIGAHPNMLIAMYGSRTQTCPHPPYPKLTALRRCAQDGEDL